MNRISKITNGLNESLTSVKYKNSYILVEKEEKDSDGKAYSCAIYLGNCEWHEFEGSGLHFTPQEAIIFCQNIIDRDEKIINGLKKC